MKTPKSIFSAVCCVIRNREDPSRILLVSRKNDTTSFGLPGGKVDSGETLLEAAIREVKEETGLDVVLDPNPVYHTKCPAHVPPPKGQDFYTFAFLAKSYSGVVATKEAGVVKWGNWEDQSNGSFAAYNEGVRKALQKLGR